MFYGSSEVLLVYFTQYSDNQQNENLLMSKMIVHLQEVSACFIVSKTLYVSVTVIQQACPTLQLQKPPQKTVK